MGFRAKATATFALPEILFGELPAGGATARLAKVVGASQAKRLIMTGERLHAEHARRIGLVDDVHQPADLIPAAMAFANVLAARPSYATRAAKLLVDRSLDVDTATAQAFERQITRTMAGPEEKQRARDEAAASDPTYAQIFAGDR